MFIFGLLLKFCKNFAQQPEASLTLTRLARKSPQEKLIYCYNLASKELIMRFFIFMLGVFGGLLVVVYHRQLARSIGMRIGWAERIFGPGGTYYGYLVIGFVAILIGLFVGLGFIPVNWFSSPV
jgi:hypothetical protein